MSDCKQKSFFVPLLAGGCAGTTADVFLFPLDTIKTRLQSSKGFRAAGGFHRIYSGILPAFIASAPTAAVFFTTYELTKSLSSRFVHDDYAPVAHMLAAAAGELVAGIVRVPFEIVKQRSQTNCNLHSSSILSHILATEGVRGLFRGYLCSISRDVPFSFLQYPLWEYLKTSWSSWQGHPTDPWQGAVCGSVAGSTAAAITTPLDVAKTRIMLAEARGAEKRMTLPQLVISIGRNEGFSGLFSGLVPRVSWTAVGGFVFLGAYELVNNHLIKFQLVNILQQEN